MILYFYIKNSTLAQRIEMAGADLINQKSSEEKRKEALDFLIFVFDLDEPKTKEEEEKFFFQIIELLQEKLKYKKTNPGFIPKKSPKILDELNISPDNRKLTKKDISDTNVKDAIKLRELLVVNRSDAIYDKRDKVNYFDDKMRDKHRLLIRNGKFYTQLGELFDSSKMESHEKKGFIGYTLNANGEISYFRHIGREKNENNQLLLHSSMNAGNPVVSAGELKIVNGELKEITNHSGHYKPSLFNVYRMIEHLKDQKVNIDDVKVITHNKISENICSRSQESKYKFPYDDNPYESNYYFEAPAIDLFDKIRSIFHGTIKSLDNYINNNKITSLFLLTNKPLTEKRVEYSKEYLNKVSDILSSEKKDNKIELINTLDVITDNFINKNNQLSVDHGKKENSGRLNKRVNEFKKKIEYIKNNIDDYTSEGLTENLKNEFKKNF